MTRQGDWRGLVLYQIYPRSYFDKSGDGIGDLAGITEKLDYVASLGVDGVWLSPFFKSPMRDFGYDVSDYCDVDPIFGTLDDFDRLLARAHDLGLKVIIDQVLAHTSDQHPWFGESRNDEGNPKADWYVWADARPDGTPPNNWQSIFTGPSWTWDTRRRQYYLHNFLPSQPALNVRNQAVQDALLEVCRFWLDRGVDGFRLDAINHCMCDPELRDNPIRRPAADGSRFAKTFDYQHSVHNISHPDVFPFLTRLRHLCDRYEDRFMIAEIGGEKPFEDMVAYTRGGDRLHSAYSFDFLEAETLTPQMVRSFVEPWLGPEAADSWPAWAFSNHDRPRAVSRWRGENTDPTALARQLLTLLVFLRGNIFIYQGEELGLPQATVPFERLTDPEAIANWPTTLGRDGTRTPMPWHAADAAGGFSPADAWLPSDPAQRALAVDVQEEDPYSVLNFCRQLLAFRRDHPALVTGSMEFLDLKPPLLGFRREQLTMVFNLSQGPVDCPVKGKVVFQANGSDADRLTAHGAIVLV